MHTKESRECLILPDLSIKEFRGIESLSIPRLGQVTLIAGRTGSARLPCLTLFAFMPRTGPIRFSWIYCKTGGAYCCC